MSTKINEYLKIGGRMKEHGKSGWKGTWWSGRWKKDWDLKNDSELARHKGGDCECFRERGLGLVRARGCRNAVHTGSHVGA